MVKINKKIIGRIVAMVALIAVLNFGYWAYHHRHSPITAAPEETVEVSAIRPPIKTITVTRTYIGQVEAINQIDIVPYISGYVAQIKVDGGQNVQQGDVLAVLQQEEYIAALQQATAQIAASEADYANAKAKYERMQKAGPKAVSPTDMDSAKAAYLSASAAVEKAKAGALAAKTDLDYTYLTAPFDGVLGNISVSVGEYVSPQSQSLMTLVQYNPIRVVFSVPDKEYLNHFQAEENNRLTVKIKLSNGTIYQYEGSIKYTANILDEKTDSMAVYAEFANPNRELIPNAYVELLLERTYTNVFLLSKDRMVLKPDGDFVYVVKDNVVQLQPVHILGEYKNQYVINNDFTPTTYLITENIEPQLLEKTVKIRDLQTEK